MRSLATWCVALAALVNVNSATLAELDTLPRIGPVIGQRIIDARPIADGVLVAERA